MHPVTDHNAFVSDLASVLGLLSVDNCIESIVLTVSSKVVMDKSVKGQTRESMTDVQPVITVVSLGSEVISYLKISFSAIINGQKVVYST